MRGEVGQRLTEGGFAGGRGEAEGVDGGLSVADFMDQLHLYVDAKLEERGHLYEMAAHIF